MKNKSVVTEAQEIQPPSNSSNWVRACKCCRKRPRSAANACSSSTKKSKANPLQRHAAVLHRLVHELAGANIHSSLFMDIHQYMVKNANVSGVDA